MNGLWLYLHFPLLPLEMQCTADAPEPSILLDERAARVLLCNDTARAQGLEPGMAVARALSMVPDVRLLQEDAKQAEQQLQGLALWSGRFSARVSLQPPCGLLLELDAKLRAQLRGLGFNRLGDLLALPSIELAHRFGPGITAWLERLTGQRPDPPVYFDMPAAFLRELPLAYEVERTEALLFGLRRLLSQLEGFLRAHYWRALRLQLDLLQLDGQQSLAGIVTNRQRPGSASGVTFVTLEDETGQVNLVVWRNTAAAQRQALLGARLMQVSGVLEREGDIIHVVAGRLTDITPCWQALALRSRDFH